MPAKKTPIPITELVADLRKRSGYSLRQAQALAGMSSLTTWVHYEKAYTKDELPVDLAITLLTHFVGIGEPKIKAKEILDACPKLAVFLARWTRTHGNN